MWGYGYGWWPGVLMMGLGMVFWLALLGVAVWAVARWAGPRAQHRDDHAPLANKTALDILRERYARGEIDAATFDEMRERLKAPSGLIKGPPDVA